MDLIADVTADANGKYQVDISESSQETERKVGSDLGKEDFLMLLVTQRETSYQGGATEGAQMHWKKC